GARRRRPTKAATAYSEECRISAPRRRAATNWLRRAAAPFRTCNHLTPYKAKKPLAECKRSGHCKRGETRALPKKLKIVTASVSALSNDFGTALSLLGANQRISSNLRTPQWACGLGDLNHARSSNSPASSLRRMSSVLALADVPRLTSI